MTTPASPIFSRDPARLLDVVEGRSGTVLAGWLAERDTGWRAGIHTASLEPFRGYAHRAGYLAAGHSASA